MRAALVLAAVLAALSAAAPAHASSDGAAGLWAKGWYAPPTRTSPAPAAGPRRAADDPAETVCLERILEEERRLGLPKDLLMAVALTESGHDIGNGVPTSWPWTVNLKGKGHRFATKSEAVSFVRKALAEGKRSVDVGCMQVNLRWHPAAFPDLERAFDPAANVAYAARFLEALRAAEGSWNEAVGRYHSSDPARAAAYGARVAESLRIAETVRRNLDHLGSTGPSPGAAPPPRRETPQEPAPTSPTRFGWAAALPGAVAGNPYGGPASFPVAAPGVKDSIGGARIGTMR